MLTGAYVLSALSDAEHAKFETHLRACSSCTDEVTGLREATARLGSSVDKVSPRVLRPDVMHAAGQAQQVPRTSEIGATPSRRQGLRHAAALVSAACVAAVLVAGVHGALTTTTTVPATSLSPRTQIGDLLAAPDLRLVGTGNATGTAAMSRHRDEMLFLADDLPALPHDRAYQLWLVDSRGPHPAGVLRPTGGVASLLVAGIEDVRETIVTAEPLSGSPSPTGSPVISIALR
ncbi:anti-sigma factor domain-containing protein [Lentzea sp. JNUCC 0626]|uniref:anti-sigma factor n=1 Tax=Lentzea sp. JNUCC 0626 TaxID=3367513 RepID=UPI0037498CD3